jgi:hypothetical protein
VRPVTLSKKEDPAEEASRRARSNRPANRSTDRADPTGHWTTMSSRPPIVMIMFAKPPFSVTMMNNGLECRSGRPGRSGSGTTRPVEIGNHGSEMETAPEGAVL